MACSGAVFCEKTCSESLCLPCCGHNITSASCLPLNNFLNEFFMRLLLTANVTQKYVREN